MDDDSRLEKLINQCKSNDVDVKVDAVTKLQAEFENGIEINDPDGLINVFKTCLRSSNQHLSTATLSALPTLLPLLIAHSLNPLQSNVQGGIPPSASSSTSSLAPSSIIDAVTLRQVLTAFLPAGGVIDRLGDKEKAQVKARETLVVLGGLAYRSGGTGTGSGGSKARDPRAPETPIMIFERFLREAGLTSKVWKVREQSILTLVHIRRTHHLFPIRPYLPLLVDALEDTDAHVRECARQSVVELFSGPAVTDAARADLKKEMTKKGVRKTIVDGVLSKLIGGRQQAENSENGDAKPVTAAGGYVPPSLALAGRKPVATNGALSRSTSQIYTKDSVPSRPGSRASSRAAMSSSVSSQPPTPSIESVELQSVYIASSRDLENEFAKMQKPFEGKENEHNWAAREAAVQRVRGMIKGDVHLRYMDTFLACLKDGFVQWSLKALGSLRTTLSANTCSLYSEMALALGPSLDPFVETLVTNLLRMAGFTKKIAAQQSQSSVSTIIVNASPQPRIVLPLLWNTLQEKTVQSRAFVVAHIKHYIEVHGHRSKHAIESSIGLDILEKSVKKSLSDANPAVKESARVCFWVFDEVWPDRGAAILESLEPLARRQLEKVCPNPELAAGLPPVTPKNNKKTSVAAAIAASRAKAKAIATAPPSLRHQATSTSHAVRATSPPLRRGGSPTPSNSTSTHARPASPLRLSTSPPSPRSRIVSNNMPRSLSSNAISSHSRTPSHARTTSGSAPPPLLPSPTLEQPPSTRRRTSSPLAPVVSSPPRSSTIRKAMQTALPASPPSPMSQSSPTPTPTIRNGNGTARNIAVPLPPRASTMFDNMDTDDESLLLATVVPIPEDSDSDDMDESINLMSFSTPFEMYPPLPPATPTKSTSQAHSISPQSDGPKAPADVSNASLSLSNSMSDVTSNGHQPIVEDALRATAEQAESAAERLLELVEPEEEGMQHPGFPASLLVGSAATSTPKPKSKVTPMNIPQGNGAPPVTPVNKNTLIMRQAALFQDSPAYNGHRASSSLLEVLQDRKHETGWWLKRMTLIGRENISKPLSPSERVQQLPNYIAALGQDKIDTQVLQNLALLCIENPVEPQSPDLSPYPSSPSPFVVKHQSSPSLSLHAAMWDKEKTFERLFKALILFLDHTRSEEEIEYGLIVLWEMLENQSPYLEGREADIFSVLLQIRYCNKSNVLEATNTIRDALTTRIEPVYGLTTMHASLRAFHMDPLPVDMDREIKAATYAFGLIALGKFFLRLPAEIAEEELPRLKGTLISALNDKSSLVIRESAAATIIAAQVVLRDETHLFALLDDLADEKKNLLTYLFDKHGARGLGVGPSGVDKLEKEMRRLDTRTSTPRRP